MVLVSKKAFSSVAKSILKSTPNIGVDDFVNEILEEVERDEDAGAVGDGGGRGSIPIDSETLTSTVAALSSGSGTITVETVDAICSQIEDEYHRSLFLLFKEGAGGRKRRGRSTVEHISIDDVREASRKVGMELSDTDAAMMVEEFDSEGKGGVSLEEFVAILKEGSEVADSKKKTKKSSTKVTRARDQPKRTVAAKGKTTKGKRKR
jgi:hypothetical protein